MKNKLKELRLSRGLTAMQIGNEVGYSKAQMSYLENDKFLPGVKDAPKIAKLLKCEVKELYPVKELLSFFKNSPTGKKETLFGEDVKKVQFRLNKGGYNLLELAKKELGCTDKHDLYRRVIEPFLIHKIKLAQLRKEKQKNNVVKFINQQNIKEA